MPIDSDSIGAVPYGEQSEGLLTALAEAARTLNLQAAEALAALDITSPTWDSTRPVWHLDLIERVYRARAEPTLVPELRYRIARARIFARHCDTTLDGLIHVFSALIGAPGVDPARLRIIAQPMVVYFLFSHEATPPPEVMDRVLEIARTSVQDVAGFGFVGAPEGVDLDALFTLDAADLGAMAFDEGALAIDLDV